jgi:APA family basic amino acid/polyamine antiporter
MEPTRLARRLTASDAVILGLASMIGAGIFSAAGPAVRAAGAGVLLAVAIAGSLAFLNAISMAQLAVIYPESGGAYAYGRNRLGPFWGFLAGWGFVIGKLASCTAMALTFGYYVAPNAARPLACGVVILLTVVNYFGVKKTMTASKILLGITLLCLGLVVFGTMGGGSVPIEQFSDWTGHGGIAGILQASGLMFFAFAGYARIATMGEEVIEPRRTIPIAIYVSLSITLLIYLIVIGSTLLTLEIETIATSSSPLATAVASGEYPFLVPLVRIGAAVACVGVLLSLIAGVSRTVFAMAAQGDLPKSLSSVHPIHKVPDKAELIVGIVITIVVAFADLRNAIGFSSFAVLTYYAVANVAAWKLAADERKYPRVLSLLGLIACLVIAFSLPAVSILGGVLLFAIGTGIYFYRSRQNSLR